VLDKKRNGMRDILDQDMERVFKACDKEQLSRVLIFLENFRNPEIKSQASFKRDDIPLIKVWVDIRKEKQRKKEKIEERFFNLFSLVAGTLIGAGVTLYVAKAQLDNLGRQHEEAIKQQKETIEQTFENGLNLMLLQYKIESELRFLKDIYACVENDFDTLFPEIHKMRNNWKEQLVATGKTAWLQKLDNIRYRISEAIKKFDKLLKKNSHHKEIYDEFYGSMSFQGSYSNPITDLCVDIERFPDNFTVGNLKVLDSRGEKFSKAVNVLHKWIEDTKKSAQDKQQEIYKLRQKEIRNQ